MLVYAVLVTIARAKPQRQTLRFLLQISVQHVQLVITALLEQVTLSPVLQVPITQLSKSQRLPTAYPALLAFIVINLQRPLPQVPVPQATSALEARNLNTKKFAKRALNVPQGQLPPLLAPESPSIKTILVRVCAKHALQDINAQTQQSLSVNLKLLTYLSTVMELIRLLKCAQLALSTP